MPCPDQTPQMWAEELKLAISEGRRTPVALSRYHREGHARFFGIARRRQVKTPDEPPARALYDVRMRSCAHTVCRPTNFQPRAAGRGVSTQSGLYWRARNMPASVRALMAASTSMARTTRSATEKRVPRPGGAVEANRPWARQPMTTSTAKSAPTIFSEGIGVLRRASIPGSTSDLSGRTLDPGRIAVCARKAAIFADADGPAAGDAVRIFRCSMRVVADLSA